MNKPIYIKKADGQLEPFDPKKLVESLERVGVEPDNIQQILDDVSVKIEDGMTTGQIYTLAFDLLRRSSMGIAVKYSLRRALSELGPDGFPFEKYIAALMEARGYHTLTDQVVYGHCVSHEIDVVAWKDGATPEQDELLMIEAKFHNEFGLKSDLKVALYIKARFDDLKQQTFEYGGKKRSFTNGWLITNTKFTEQAIRYGECQGLKMIGWNYPKHGNLHHLIEESKLHPFTCLATLSNTDKRKLLSKGVILCKDIAHKPNVLDEAGVDKVKHTSIIKEIGQVCEIDM